MMVLIALLMVVWVRCKDSFRGWCVRLRVCVCVCVRVRVCVCVCVCVCLCLRLQTVALLLVSCRRHADYPS